MGKYLVPGLLTLLASGSAAAGLFTHEVSVQDLDGIHRMAVHVRMGDTFHAIFIGTTVFNNKAFDVPVPQWAMDQYVSDQVVEIMKLRGRFPAEPLAVADLDLPALYQKSGAILASKEVVGTLLAQARQQGAHALLVVEMAGRTYFECKELLRLCGDGAAACPPGVARVLQELDGHAHR